MKTKNTRRINLFECGKDEWEGTAEYREKVGKIVQEITEKYSGVLDNEKSWLKRILLRIRRGNEIRKEVDKLSSMKNLHAVRIF